MIRRLATRLRTHLLGLFADADVAGSCCPVEHDDVMDVAEAVEVTPHELAGLCDRDTRAYVRMRNTADACGIGVRDLADYLNRAMRSHPDYADACTAVTDDLLERIRREADRIDSAALWLEHDSYTPEGR